MSELTMTTEYGIVNNINGGTTMNRSELVRQYVAANPPDQDLCPTCYQYWKDSKGCEILWDNVSGHRRRERQPGYTRRGGYFSTTPRRSYDGSYVKYIPEYEMLEVAQIVLNVNGRGIDGVPVDWVFVERMFAFKGDTACYDEAGEMYQGSRYYSKEFVRFMHRLTYANYHENFSKLRETMNSMGGQFDNDTYVSMWRLEDWYKRNWKSRSVSATAKAVTEYQIPMFNIGTMANGNHVVLHLQILDSDYAVLRRFIEERKYNYDTRDYEYTDKWNEDVRVFIDKKGKVTVMMKNYGSDFKITTRQIDRWWYDDKKMTLAGDPIENWEPIKYLKDIIDWNDRSCVGNLVTILRHPIVEMLSKSGYPHLAKELTDDNAVAANLKAYFYVTERKKPIYELLEVNKFVLKKAEEIAAAENHRTWGYRDGISIIRDLKRLYGESEENADIRSLSKETVELAMEGLRQIEWSEFRELLGYGSWQYRRQSWFEITPETRKFIERMFRINKKSDVNLIKMYIDVRRLYDQLDNNHRPNIDITDFDDAHGLEIIHNGLVALKTEQDRERQAYYDAKEKERLEMRQKKFEKLQEERVKKYERDGDKFCIRVPHAPEEITQEGCALHHCVGGYVDRHCLGNTDIIFLRRMEVPSLPFYTIEVQNGVVIQIHGSHNKWLGNNPDAIPFVWQWVNDLGLKCEKKLLLNLGAGYSSSKEQLDESYLTKS